jgi:hypothetical protein
MRALTVVFRLYCACEQVGYAYELQAEEFLGFYNSFLGMDVLVARTKHTGAVMKVHIK